MLKNSNKKDKQKELQSLKKFEGKLEIQKKHQEKRLAMLYRIDYLNYTKINKIYLSLKKNQEEKFQKIQMKKQKCVLKILKIF